MVLFCVKVLSAWYFFHEGAMGSHLDMQVLILLRLRVDAWERA